MLFKLRAMDSTDKGNMYNGLCKGMRIECGINQFKYQLARHSKQEKENAAKILREEG